ncbi:endonuclease/exonuclease/phosphatase family protein [Jannaschia ovalis]|uniref:Endonuclease/exonuclease/phosphatase family protein n=1 Tax=Jannaschia ovalis TaxID=3038773 RepID=A0ABY8LA71_9RHOB|nr:endonuclease/exonuclease/phosphatase family protein [Jannaschia sp. GRR-S6-38]WGH78201.1 endonuclease/exonuclease/phosphatase family protein [Jannaschia sp. GRR-S6-38]
MRVVSLNAWGGAVWDALSDWVERAEFDMLCLQEVTRRLEPGPDWLVYGDAYRHLDQRADLFGDVSARLAGWQAAFAPAARGPLRDADGRMHRSEHGIAAWVAPGLAVTARLQGFVHGAFRAEGWGSEPVPRAVQSLRVEGAGRPVAVTHLHGLRDPRGKGDTPERAAQTAALVAHLRAFDAGGACRVVAGDLNLRPDSATFAALRAEGLVDLVTGRGHADTRTRLYTKPERHANYCLVSDSGRVRGFAVPATPVLSDHRPLILELAA